MDPDAEDRTLHLGEHGKVVATRKHCHPIAWAVRKTVQAGAHGRRHDNKPHDIYKEATLLNDFPHPNLVELLEYEHYPETSTWTLTMPALAFTLERFDVDIEPYLLQSLLFQICLGLDHLHDLDIAHRDLKPSNIMVDWDGRVKLIDLGIAWDETWDIEEEVDSDKPDPPWREFKDSLVNAVGTGRYRAPELLFGSTTYEPCDIDLWALGVLITDFFPVFLPPDSPIDKDESESDGSSLRTRSSTTSLLAYGDGSPRLFDDTHGDLGLAASIFQVLGTPTDKSWPQFSSLPDAGKVDFVPMQAMDLLDVLPDMHFLLHGMLDELLRLSPTERMPSSELLHLEYFKNVLVPDSQDTWFPSKRGSQCQRPWPGVVKLDGVSLMDLLADEFRRARNYWHPVEIEPQEDHYQDGRDG